MWNLILTAALAAPGLGPAGPQSARDDRRARLDDYLTQHGHPAAAVFETWQGEARVPRAAG